jgi:pimeloyl-ACP methyl ester carboxylesterase
MPAVKGPLLVVWGSNDSFTPIDGPVGKLFRALPDTRPQTEFHELPGNLVDRVHAVALAESGGVLVTLVCWAWQILFCTKHFLAHVAGENHCVHDDNPELVNGIVCSWLKGL